MTAHRTPLREELSWFVASSMPPRLRTMREFAEQEFRLPEGPYRDRLWRAERQPFAGLLLDLIDSGRWPRHAILGCVQSGKSLHGYVLPALYHLFESRETVVCGVPTMDIAADKWREELLPVIRAGRYAQFLPRIGGGARGGTKNLESVKFTHGPTLKFMSGGGGDEKRSSFTTRVVICTEVDKFDEAGEASREADPISQIEARMAAYDAAQRRFYGECTVSIVTGRIWREYLAGTATRIVCQCPHCRAWITPEREHLVGWADAESEADAARLAFFACAECGAAISDEERRAMNAAARVVHRGQEITPDGTITGEPIETNTLGFRWNAFNNLFWSTSTIAAKEWLASRAEDEENAKKELLQFYWAQPYEPPEMDDTPLDARAILRRKEAWPQNILPPDTRYVTVGADVGKWACWYLVMAFRECGRIHIPDYGVIDVHSDDLPEPKAVLQALRELRDRVLSGWQIEGGEPRTADRCWVDSHYLTDTVHEFLAESGEPTNNRWLGSIGFGASQMRKQLYRAPARTGRDVRTIGTGWHLVRVPRRRAWQVNVDADHWKRQLQHCLALGLDQPGGISLFDATGNRHQKLAKHFTSERLVREMVTGKGEQERWEKRGQNHWLDCGYNALAAGNFCGFRLVDPERPAATVAPRRQWFGQRKGVRA